METLIAPAINLAILIGVLAYLLRTPVKDFVRNRHVYLRDELKNVSEQLEEARRKYEDFDRKLKSLDEEVASLHQQVMADANEGRDKILHEAKDLGQKIVSDAQASARQMFEDVKEELRAELGLQVLSRAEKILKERLTGDDRARIRKEFSRLVENIPSQGAAVSTSRLQAQHVSGSNGRLMR